MITLLNLIESGHQLRSFLTRYRKWYPLAIQFLIGGLFSAFVVFYFKSASFSKASIFFIFLLIFLVANEFLEKRYTNIYYQVSLYFLVNFSFFIFVIPVIFRHTGLLSFLAGGIISVMIVEGLVYFLARKSVLKPGRPLTVCRGIPPVLFFILFIFYTLNWIPPVPLSLKFSGVYHNVVKSVDAGQTQYELSFEKPPWYKPWKTSDSPFVYNDGDRVFAYSAVFASTDLKTRIFHHWRFYSEDEKTWKTSDRIQLDISGGRDLGYRLYTVKQNVQPGKWRIDIETGSGKIIGSIDFSIIPGEGKQVDLKTILR